MDTEDVGELLIKIFMLCKEHNVDISIGIADRNVFGPSAFKIRLERDEYCISKVVDTTPTYRDPKYVVESVFNNALYSLNHATKEE
jgi:hypothetical protein